MDQINIIFDNLDDWRHLPAYQLERRADIFFSVYLPSLLESKFEIEIDSIIPEFPIRIGTIDPEKDTNLSNNIDYFAKVKGEKKVIFVELKTDDSSRRDEQDLYLERVQEVGLANLLNGLQSIYKATKSKRKYKFLLDKLMELDLLTIADDGKFKPIQEDCSITVVYLQPNNFDEERNVISFDEVAEIIEQKNDCLSNRFAQSLREWARVKAGER
ncbi:hypothetical protein ACFLYP_03775 [Chloroflexota bacterium]